MALPFSVSGVALILAVAASFSSSDREAQRAFFSALLRARLSALQGFLGFFSTGCSVILLHTTIYMTELEENGVADGKGSNVLSMLDPQPHLGSEAKFRETVLPDLHKEDPTKAGPSA